MDTSSYDKAANYLDVIRNMILHENELINQRLSWMFALQGLLFAAIGFLWCIHLFPVVIIGLVGLLSCLSIGYTLLRGMNAIKDLLSIASNFKKALPKHMTFPPTIGARRKAIEILLPANLLPWILGMAWIGILIFRVGYICTK